MYPNVPLSFGHSPVATEKSTNAVIFNTVVAFDVCDKSIFKFPSNWALGITIWSSPTLIPSLEFPIPSDE